MKDWAMLLLPHWLKIVVRSPEARLVPSAALKALGVSSAAGGRLTRA